MRALVLHRDPDHRVSLDDIPEVALPEGDVRLDVSHSSLNYKDGLAITNTSPIIRGDFPFVPGIDLAGTVRESSSDEWSSGDAVILTGWGTGENRWGGYAEQARADSSHLVALPEGLTAEDAMWMGTAGFTAALSVLAIQHRCVEPGDGPIAVTGASGGVGSVAVGLLAAAGYEVHAVTGSPDAHDYLRALGASEITPRADLSTPPTQPMGKGVWAGAVDSVGGSTLETLIATAKRRACIAACGLAGGHTFSTTVFPFILRGVVLHGIDSNTMPRWMRAKAWALLAEHVANGALTAVRKTVIGLEEVPEWSRRIVAGDTIGRVVVAVR
ncbi:MAG: MDR family oxidoreductase [Bacteroidota bacterium]